VAPAVAAAALQPNVADDVRLVYWLVIVLEGAA
jgi:hypothetical protein